MKKIIFILCLLFMVHTVGAQSVKKVVVDAKDSTSGYYLAIEPQGQIEGVLVLLSGFSQHSEDIFPETKLPNVAYANNILTIGFAAGYKVYADKGVQDKLTATLKDVITRYKVDPSKFVLGGYSAGGTIVLRYVELCNQYPSKFPIKAKGVFMVDSPIDVFSSWDMFEGVIKDNYSEYAVSEAKEAIARMKQERGVPKENVAAYAEVTPFSMNKAYCDNEKYLQQTAVRAYHDVDIAWRLVNRRQTVHNSNYEFTAELINRLLMMGNTKAEFMQATGKGYRSNGMRHPHSWSIVNEVECIQWIKGII